MVRLRAGQAPDSGSDEGASWSVWQRVGGGLEDPARHDLHSRSAAAAIRRVGCIARRGARRAGDGAASRRPCDDALCRLLARALGVRASDVTILRGERTRDNAVAINGVDQAAADAGGPRRVEPLIGLVTRPERPQEASGLTPCDSFRSCGNSRQAVALSRQSNRAAARDRTIGLPRRRSRRIVQLDGAKISASAESHFGIERDLHDGVAAHPEVLQEEDIGLGPPSRPSRKLLSGSSLACRVGTLKAPSVGVDICERTRGRSWRKEQSWQALRVSTTQER